MGQLARALALIAALLAAAALSAGGCGGSGTSAGAGGRITLQLFGDAEELAIYRELIREYKSATGHRVQLIEVPDRDAHLAKLATAFGAGSPPDVFLVNYRNFAGYAARGVLEPIGPLLDRSRHLERRAFFQGPLEAFTWERVLQCLPQNASSLVVYFNRSLFRQAGVAPPSTGWSYEEFLSAARALAQETAGEGHAVGIDPGLVRLAPFIWSSGGELINDQQRPRRLMVDTAEGRAALARMVAIRREGLSPGLADVESQPLDDRFVAGRLAMLFGSRREVPKLRTIRSFEWDVADFPTIVTPATVLHSDAYCIARGASEDAWRFIEWTAGTTGQQILARSGRTVPSLRAVADSAAFLRPDAPPASAQVFLDGIPRTRALPVHPAWADAERRADLALERAYYGGATPEETVTRILRDTTPLLQTG